MHLNDDVWNESDEWWHEDQTTGVCSSSSRYHLEWWSAAVSHIAPIFSIQRSPRCLFHAFCHRIMSFKPSLPIHFPLNRTLHQLAPAVSDCVANETYGKIAAINNSYRSCLVVLNYARILWYVRCSVQLTSNIRRFVYILLTVDPQVCWFDPLIISFRQSPAFCAISENDTGERTNYMFRSLFIPLSLHIGTRSRIIFLAFPIRDLVCLLQLPSADFSDPRYLKCSTASICSSSCLILESNFNLSWLQFPQFPPIIALTQCVVKKCTLPHSSLNCECTTVASIPSDVS